MLQILGVPFSAHTRKVIVAALEKSLPYEVVPTIPLKPPEGFRDVSPLGKIPVLRDGDVTIADSSVIAAYLERRHPRPSIYPKDDAAFARALWIEEYVDGAVAPHVLGGLLLEKVFAPLFLEREPNQALIDRSVNETIPPHLEYLERALDGEWFAGTFSLADVTVASMLLNYHYAGCSLSEAKYPKLRAFVRRALARKSFATAFEQEIPVARDVGSLDLGLLRSLGY